MRRLSRKQILEIEFFNYTKEFAQGILQHFKVGSHIWNLVTDPQSTFSDFILPRSAWLAQEYKGKRYKYTIGEMKDLWNVIKIQKYNNQNKYEASRNLR